MHVPHIERSKPSTEVMLVWGEEESESSKWGSNTLICPRYTILVFTDRPHCASEREPVEQASVVVGSNRTPL